MKGPAAVAVGTLVVVLGATYGFFRTIVGLGIAAAIIWLGFSYFTNAGLYPPETEAEDVGSADVRYVCSVCGLELKVEVATTDKAPTHCREKMVLVSSRGPSPANPTA